MKDGTGTFRVIVNGEIKVTAFSLENALRQAREFEDTDVRTIEVYKLVAISVPRVEEV
jgi:hypothetical protein